MSDKKVTFKPYEQEQGLLFPDYMDEHIPTDHLVRTINTVIDSLNLSKLEQNYKGGGASSYHPRMMLKVIVYAYSQKIYSSRGIAKALRENIFFMWLSGKNMPDFRTINLFRKNRLSGELKGLFTEIVRILLDGGFVTMKDLFVDGTKLEADANKYTFVWKKSTLRYKDKLTEQVKELFRYIDQLEMAEDHEYEGYDLPEMGERVTITSEEIKKRIEALNRSLGEQPDKELKKVKKKLETDALPRMQKYEKHLEIMDTRNSYSKTDPDATFMRMKDDHMRNGQLKAGYNIQIGTENQYILAYNIYQKPTDTTLLPHFLDSFEEQYAMLPENLIADAGYGSEENYEYIESAEINCYVKYNMFHKEKKKKFKENPYRVENLIYNSAEDNYTCPAGKKLFYAFDKEYITDNGFKTIRKIYECEDCTGCIHRDHCHKSQYNRRIQVSHRLNELKKNARDNLDSGKGLEYRSRRCVDVEPVFAQIKHNKEYKRFMRRGLEGVTSEWGLLSIVHNLTKLHNQQNALR